MAGANANAYQTNYGVGCTVQLPRPRVDGGAAGRD